MVIYGAGRHFSSGANIDNLFESISNESVLTPEGNIQIYPDFLHDNIQSFTFFDSLEIPVISAIRGVCLGSALELALFSHIRICGKGSIFALPETTFNLIPGCGGIQKIIEQAGFAKGLELIIRGNNFSSSEALELHIVDAVVPKKEVIDRALSLAEHIADNYDRKNIQDYIDRYL